MTEPEADRSRESNPPTAPDEASPVEAPRVVRRREPRQMTAEERAFLTRHRADMPPHHDSAWG